MKRYKFVSLLFLLILITLSCQKYDDSELWDELNSLEKRIIAIENQLKSLNSNISSLSELVDILQNRRYVTDVIKLIDGYIITFSDGSKVTINDGKDGADGNNAPLINIRYFNDRYYWTQTIDGNTSWLTDSDGNLIPASGIDGITPLIKIDSDGFWIISYNAGQTYSRILDENGSSIKALGNDGDPMFASVETYETEIRIVLSDDTEIIIPIGEVLPYKGIDLNLSVKWSSINFGVDSYSDLGGLYLWGDVNDSGVVPNYSAPNLYNISGTEYDIIRANWGESWRIPNMNEFSELVNNCQWSRATINGVVGMRVTGTNGNSIFLPNTGYGIPVSGPIGQTERILTDNAYYWVGESFLSDGERFGYALHINNFTPLLNYGWNVNFMKMAIRPVRGY